MKKLRHSALVLASLGLLVTGCVTTRQARSMKKIDVVLGDAGEKLQPGKGDQALLVYVNPDVKWQNYQNVLVEPVTYWVGEGEKDGLNEEQRKALIDYFYAQLRAQFAKSYTVVDVPGPNTLRYSAALINAEHSYPALSSVSTLMPIGLGLNTLKTAVTGRPSLVGAVTTAVKVTDAKTGELLGAAEDQRVGGLGWKDKFDKWEAVESSARYWAQQSVYRLCTLQDLTACQKPTEY